MGLGADLLLLAVDGERERMLLPADKIKFALRGSQLVELAIARRIEVADKRIRVIDPAPTGDPLLDAALATLTAARKPPRTNKWVQAAPVRLRADYLAGLVAAGTVQVRRRKMLGFITAEDVALVEPGRQAAVRARLDRIAGGAPPADARDRALAGLVSGIGLADRLYRGGANRALRKHLKSVAHFDQSDQVGRVSADVFDATLAAMAATDGSVDAATDAATNSAIHAATNAAVHAATHAAVEATHHAAHSGHDGGGGGHGGGHH